MATASIEIPHQLGVTLWWAGSGAREERVQCPECCGTRVIEMVKGNGERVSLDCALCGTGYDSPRGWVTRYVYEHAPTPFVAQRVRIDGDEFWYSESPPDASAYGSVRSTDLFADRDECQVACDAKNKLRAKMDEENLLHQITHKRKNMAFSAQYWRSQERRLEEQLALVRARITRKRSA